MYSIIRQNYYTVAKTVSASSLTVYAGKHVDRTSETNNNKIT